MKWLVLFAIPLSAEPLTVQEVLRSVDRSFPLIEAAMQERQLAEGSALQARGEFDLKLKAEAESQQLGFYRNEMFKGMLEQNTTLFGTSVYGGYRVGRGTFGPYDEKALTLRGGEWSGEESSARRPKPRGGFGDRPTGRAGKDGRRAGSGSRESNSQQGRRGGNKRPPRKPGSGNVIGADE